MQLGIKDFEHRTKVPSPVVTGLCAGTRVTTLRGDIPVEDLRAGDRVITRDRGAVTLVATHSETAAFAPIRIKAGSIGHARPDEDMITTPGAQLYIRDWRAQAFFGRKVAAVPASRLIDGEFVAETEQAEMQIIHLSFDRPHIIYANGVEMVIDS